MSLVLADRVRQSTTTSGTGTVTLADTLAGYQSFAVIGDGNTTYYTMVDNNTGDWEVGIGTYTASGTTLSRDTVLESSNSNALVDFATGVKDVFVTYPADRAVWANAVPQIVTFTSPGTYDNIPTKLANGLKSIKVTVVGGGGGGGGARAAAPPSTAIYAAGGGGGGGSAIEYIPAATLAPSAPTGVTVTVGAGGTAGPATTPASSWSNAGDGGTSSFGAFCSATGGVGFLAATVNGGAGGIGSGGDLNVAGSGGGSGSASPVSVDYGAFGGSSMLGGGAQGVYLNNAALPGREYGGGGGGAVRSASPVGLPGAGGADGVVIIEEFY